VRIDRRRKMHATVLIRALGFGTQQILDRFYANETVYLGEDGSVEKSVDFDLLSGQRATQDIKIGDEVIVRKNTKFTRAAIKKLKASKLERLTIEPAELIGKVSAEDVIDKETGEVLLECNEEVTETTLERIRAAGVKEFKVLFIDGLNVGSYLRDT
jgi:DNA-directed RNA polymerase subunit beta